jgi:D-galactarolactone cycloisomerase
VVLLKIQEVEFIPINVPLKTTFYPAWWPKQGLTGWGTTIIKVTGDEGLVGYGSQHSIRGEVKEVGESPTIHELLVGSDVFNIERVTQILSGLSYSYTRLRLWGIEMALWDLIGKTTRKPLYKLLGGFQNRILAYASTGTSKSPKQHAEDAAKYLELGFKAIKIRIHGEKLIDDIAAVRAVREAVGSDVDILVDANQPGIFGGPLWSYERALKTAKQLEKLEVYWLEEPLHHDALNDLARLSAAVDILIAGGEDETGLHRFHQFLESDCFDVLQPDSQQTGIWQCRKIAALAEAKFRKFSPHTWGTAIDLAAGLQLACAVPNCPILEYCIDLPAFDQGHDPILKEPITVGGDGYLRVPEKPGLGIEIDEEALARFKVNA